MAEPAALAHAPAPAKQAEPAQRAEASERHEALEARPEVEAQLDRRAMLNRRPAVVAQRKAAAGLAGRSAGPRPVQPPAPPNHTGLPDRLKSGIETLSGLSMDGVKVHYDSAKPAELDALAYARGTDIHLAPGQERHLPHEAWHVVQQAEGRVRATARLQSVAISDDRSLENEADAMGAKAWRGADAGAAMLRRPGEPPGPAMQLRSAAVARPVVQRTILGMNNENIWMASISARVFALKASDPEEAALKADILRLHSTDTIVKVKDFADLEQGIASGAFDRLLARSHVESVAPKYAESEFAKPLSRQDEVKLDVAKLVAKITGDLGLPIFLGGGAAAAAMGSSRAIKDLDFKMSEAFKKRWQVGGKDRDGLAEAIAERLESQSVSVVENNIGAKEFPYVFRMRLEAGETEVEVSITSTGTYDEKAVKKGPIIVPSSKEIEVTSISSVDLALDKTFAFAERAVSDVGKLATDFTDIAVALRNNPGWISSGALEERWVAYRSKWRRDSASADADPNGYVKLAPSVGLQVALRASLVLHESALREQWGLRRLGAAMRAVVGFARSIEKIAAKDRLRVRDEILKASKHNQPSKLAPKHDPEKVPEIFQHLSKREPRFEALTRQEQSQILRTWADLKNRKDSLIKRGKTKTSAYIHVTSRLAELSLKYDLDL
jgi:hypothetical protein